ncbi:MAG: hypothetical protein HYY01_10720 [Chloroflexi bacterium]|nr:hypothetical protein [Chloroflexota bacterium]
METQQYLRFYLPGWLFLVFSSVPVALTEKGWRFVISLVTTADTTADTTATAFLIGAASLIGGLPLGYLINQFTFFCFMDQPWRGEDDRGYGNLPYVKQFANCFSYQRGTLLRPLPVAFHDFFLFSAHTENFTDWVRRRFTAMFLGYNTVVAGVASLLLWLIVTLVGSLGFTWTHLPFWIVTAIVCYVTWREAKLARQEVTDALLIWGRRHKWRERDQ